MNEFILNIPLHGTLVVSFLGLTVGVHFFSEQLKESNYRIPHFLRWLVIFGITILISLPQEYLFSASDSDVKKAINCVNETKNIRLKNYLKRELDRDNVREYKVDRVVRQCYAEKNDAELRQKRNEQSKSLI